MGVKGGLYSMKEPTPQNIEIQIAGDEIVSSPSSRPPAPKTYKLFPVGSTVYIVDNVCIGESAQCNIHCQYCGGKGKVRGANKTIIPCANARVQKTYENQVIPVEITFVSFYYEQDRDKFVKDRSEIVYWGEASEEAVELLDGEFFATEDDAKEELNKLDS